MNTVAIPNKGLAKAAWICLIVAWTLYLIPVPGLGLFVGGPLNLVAFILAIVVMAKGRTGIGLVQLLCALVVSPIVYLLGWALMGVLLSMGAANSQQLQEMSDRSAAAIEQVIEETERARQNDEITGSDRDEAH